MLACTLLQSASLYTHAISPEYALFRSAAHAYCKNQEYEKFGNLTILLSIYFMSVLTIQVDNSPQLACITKDLCMVIHSRDTRISASK